MNHYSRHKPTLEAPLECVVASKGINFFMTGIKSFSDMGKAYADFAASIIVSKSYNGHEVPLAKNKNGIVYVNLTEVAKAFPNKNLIQIVNSREIKEYCDSLSKLQNYSLADLLIVRRGGDNSGTWVHQKVALRVAQKLSPDFAVMVDSWSEELLTMRGVSVKSLTKAQQTLESVKRLCEIAQQQVELEQRQLEMESEQRLLAQKVSHIEEIVKPNGFMSVMGFANIHRISVGDNAARALGKLASKWCKLKDIKPEKVRHSRYGKVNTYPMEALRECFDEYYPNVQL